ncbi:carboxymuconolactone decarboxylase family protein [Herbidospora sp. RD11066]
MSFLGDMEAVPAEAEVDLEEFGYVMNATRFWGYRPEVGAGILGMAKEVTRGMPLRLRGIMVTACAAAYGNSYCALAWGNRLAAWSDPETVVSVLNGDDAGLTEAEHAVAEWTRKVTRRPNATTMADVEELRAAGLTDAEIFDVTTFVALRIAFSTVNDALGLRPDAQLRTTTPPGVLAAIDFGRPIAD